MQCAQCHDHPLVTDYLQSDYHGLLAFVSPGYAVERQEGDKKVTVQAERAGGDLSFESVFVKGTVRRTGPRMPDGVAIDEPFFLPGDEYEVAPADNVKSVPKFSRRQQLAEQATNGSNRAFNENIVNRLWAHMFGRGLVHPLDLHHADNPAIDPELLRELGQRFAAMNFDLRGFLRELALSETYQRPFDVPADPIAMAAEAAQQLAELEQQRPALAEKAEQSADAYSQALEAWDQAEAATLTAASELDAARNAYAEAKKKRDEAAKAASDAATEHQAKQTVAASLQEAVTAIQQAIQALPEDRELADTAQQLTAQLQRVTEQAAALAKAAEEKAAALVAPEEALKAAQPPVDAALAKLQPLNDAVKQAEQVMLEARRRSADDAQALAALNRRVQTVSELAQIPQLHQATTAAGEVVAARDSELKTAQQQLAAYATVIADSQAAVQTATAAMEEATGKMTSAAAEHGQRGELVTALTTALQAAETAQQKAPEDESLKEVVARLKERSGIAASNTAESQQMLDAATETQNTARAAVTEAQDKLAKVMAEQQRLQQVVATATQAVAAAKSELDSQRSVLDTKLGELTDRWTTDFTVASLKPLTPEQLCWSVFRVTGVYGRYWQAEVAELDKANPLTDEQKQDPAQQASRNIELEQRTFDKLKGNLGTFVSMYGAAAGQPQTDFFSTADQALFAANGGSINSWVAPAADNVTDRVIKQADPQAAAEELYLGVLTRMPDQVEAAEVASILASRTDDRNVAVQELVWGLLNSAEFRFNH
jgi:hypothetical protein